MYIQGNKLQSLQTATPSKYPQQYFKQKNCKHCGNTFNPKAPSHMYCSQECSDVGMSNRYLKRTYKINVDDYNKMYDSQNGLCYICNTEGFTMAEHHKLKLVVDHCHTTGKVRGLLCHNCNRALGLLKDNIDSFKRAIVYLERATTIREE